MYTLALVAAVGLSDWISSGVIKHLVCRPRPTHEPALEGLVHVVKGYVGGAYGFVSSHAANTMSLAVLFAMIWQKPFSVERLAFRVESWGWLNSPARLFSESA